MDSIINTPFWPFFVLFIGMITVVITITRFKFHPFIALILAAVLVGMISAPFDGMEGTNHLINAIELPMMEFGSLVGKIALVITLAAIIGAAMMESGAASKIVNSLLNRVGEKNGAIALLISAFILSIPVFLDTVFFLIIPIIITLALKTKKDYILYILVAGGAGAITHSIVPPTPGPLVVAETLNIDLGMGILVGILAGAVPTMVVLLVAKRINKRIEIPVRISHYDTVDATGLPGLTVSLLPIVVPIVLISLTSVLDLFEVKVPGLIYFLGNKNVAMAIGTMLAVWLWIRKRKLSNEHLWKEITKPLEIAGVIILITGAGGAFGAMIKHSGIGEAIQMVLVDFHIHYIFLAWLISSAMKTAQGSSTIAVITTAGIMYAIVGDGADLPYHPIYLFLSIGFGGLFVSWMNDSGFWVIAKMSGLTEKEALKTFTVVLAIASLVGVVELMLLSYIIPLK